uniref:TLDc domain-containing protein n=1 Tax=Globodera pallida TaxID=36090 RepID=A0A183BHU9_GLOPA
MFANDSSEIVLAFGRLESSALSSSAHSGGFVGCLADILFGTKMLSLDTSSSNEFTLSGCTMGPPGAILPSKKATDYGTNKEVEQLKKDDNVVDQSDEKKAEMKTTQKPTVPSSQVRPEGACALPVIPHGEREDSSGMRFGLTPNARVEFALSGTLHASP